MRWTATNLALSRYTWWLPASAQLYNSTSRVIFATTLLPQAQSCLGKSDFPQITSLRPSIYDTDRSSHGTVIMSATNFNSFIRPRGHDTCIYTRRNQQLPELASALRKKNANRAYSASRLSLEIQPATLPRPLFCVSVFIFSLFFIFKHCFAQRHSHGILAMTNNRVSRTMP